MSYPLSICFLDVTFLNNTKIYNIERIYLGRTAAEKATKAVGTAKVLDMRKKWQGYWKKERNSYSRRGIGFFCLFVYFHEKMGRIGKRKNLF